MAKATEETKSQGNLNKSTKVERQVAQEASEARCMSVLECELPVIELPLRREAAQIAQSVRSASMHRGSVKAKCQAAGCKKTGDADNNKNGVIGITTLPLEYEGRT